MTNNQNNMIIAQITDLHIGFEGKDQPCLNSKKLQTVMHRLNAQILKPDILLITGDLTHSGESWAYSKLHEQFDDIEYPILWAIGNHDDRKAFAGTFPDAEFNDGFLQYALEDWPLRIVTLDTLKTGFHGGELCQKRLAWLDETLSKKPDQPTLVAMHHPPIHTGIGWMTEREDAQWLLNFQDIVKKHNQVIHITAGHIHRPIFRKFEHATISVCPAIAPEVNLELAPIDPDKIDGRPLLIDSFPGYCLHQWNGKNLTTHTATVSGGDVIVKHDEDHGFIVRYTMDGK